MEYLIARLIIIKQRGFVHDDQGEPVQLTLTAEILPPQTVLVDDYPQGKTNQVLELPAGTYAISLLALPYACHPREVTVTLKHTSSLSPREVYFEKV